MAKTQKARKQYVCGKSGRTIEVGELYHKHSFSFGPTLIRAYEHPFKRSELTRSEYLSTALQIQEEVEELSSSDYSLPSELESVKDELVSQLEELRDETESRKDNMPENLADSPNAQLLDERVDACNEAIDELESIDFDDFEDDDDDDDDDENVDDKNSDKIEDIISEMNDAVSSLEI